MEKLNKICYTICIACIVLGVLFSILIIWGDVKGAVIWKSWITIAVFFCASLLTIGVNRIMENKK